MRERWLRIPIRLFRHNSFASLFSPQVLHCPLTLLLLKKFYEVQSPSIFRCPISTCCEPKMKSFSYAFNWYRIQREKCNDKLKSIASRECINFFQKSVELKTVHLKLIRLFTFETFYCQRNIKKKKNEKYKLYMCVTVCVLNQTH